jgi:hypothetical protein
MSFDKCPSSVTSVPDTLSEPVLGFNLPPTGAQRLATITGNSKGMSLAADHSSDKQ